MNFIPEIAQFELGDLNLAQVLLEVESKPSAEAIADASETLAKVAALTRQTARFRALQTRVDSLLQAGRLPSVEELQARVLAQPADLRARADLAKLLVAQGRYEEALDQLLEFVTRDRAFDDDYARKAMLAVFELLADRPVLVSDYRRRLAAALNR